MKTNVSSKVYVPEKTYFDGLFGMLAESLPAAWGRRLLNRLLQQKGKNPDSYTVLDRLAIVGNSGMGKLVYEPQIEITREKRMDERLEDCEYSGADGLVSLHSLHSL